MPRIPLLQPQGEALPSLTNLNCESLSEAAEHVHPKALGSGQAGPERRKRDTGRGSGFEKVEYKSKLC